MKTSIFWGSQGKYRYIFGLIGSLRLVHGELFLFSFNRPMVNEGLHISSHHMRDLLYAPLTMSLGPQYPIFSSKTKSSLEKHLPQQPHSLMCQEQYLYGKTMSEEFYLWNPWTFKAFNTDWIKRLRVIWPFTRFEVWKLHMRSLFYFHRITPIVELWHIKMRIRNNRAYSSGFDIRFFQVWYWG